MEIGEKPVRFSFVHRAHVIFIEIRVFFGTGHVPRGDRSSFFLLGKLSVTGDNLRLVRFAHRRSIVGNLVHRFVEKIDGTGFHRKRNGCRNRFIIIRFRNRGGQCINAYGNRLLGIDFAVIRILQGIGHRFSALHSKNIHSGKVRRSFPVQHCESAARRGFRVDGKGRRGFFYIDGNFRFHGFVTIGIGRGVDNGKILSVPGFKKRFRAFFPRIAVV